jgi:uncharacterized protein (DUF58 family)
VIFDEVTLRKLQQLTLIPGRIRAGAFKGERRSTKRGTSIEFADYRDYTPGDNLRRLDWNVYARLERPFIKLLEEEEDLSVHVLVDASNSMDWGEGVQNKLRFALHLAAALSAIALGAGDQLTIAVFHIGAKTVEFGPSRGPQNLVRLLQFLDGQKASGVTQLNQSLKTYTLAARRPGLAILITDLLSPDGYMEGVNHLLGQGYDVMLLHLFSPDEKDPPLSGDLRLLDIETGRNIEVSLNAGMREMYIQRVHVWRSDIEKECRSHGVRYMAITTDNTWDKVVLFEMRKAGLVI